MGDFGILFSALRSVCNMGAPMSSTKPVANPADAFLQPNDGVAISFWIISIAMIAATAFFFAEAGTVHSHWKTSLHVGALVTLVAGVHYMYMREYWVQVGKSPIVYRYVDWSITVPLQMIEFNLILKAAGKNVSSEMFWKLLLGTILMLGFGYAGETAVMNPQIGFIGGLCGWAFILGDVDEKVLNVVYNVADFVNKIAFVLACWSCAKADSEGKTGPLLGETNATAKARLQAEKNRIERQ